MPRSHLPVTTPADDLHAALAREVEGDVRSDRLTRAIYSTDASIYQIVPRTVVLPRTSDDILATLAVCSRLGVPLTCRGGGTSQAGQAIGAGVILDCSRHLDRILEVNRSECWARVQPGCVLDDLNHHVRPLGLQFAPDISTSNRATIGGMIANNSSGTHSLIHGKTIDHVEELYVVLADGTKIYTLEVFDRELHQFLQATGREADCYRLVHQLCMDHADEIERRYPKILRRVGGYNLDAFVPGRGSFNLAHLIVGSEGTLAVTLEAKVRLIPLPRARAILVVQFDHLLDALAATPAILRHQPAAVELIDKFVLDSTLLNPEARRLRDFLQGDPAAVLLVEFYGESDTELPPRLDALESELRRDGTGTAFYRATDPARQARIWKLRKAALGLSMAEKGDAKAISFVEDTAVAPERLRDYIAEFLEVIRGRGTTAGVYAHASVGCLHVRPVINLKTEQGVEQFEAIAREVAELVLEYGGALSGEHGDGLVRSPFQEKMYGPTLYQAFRRVKQAFDPQGILNPGKIVDAPPLRANLRFGPRYVTPEVPTLFDFSADGGIVRAAELCAGVGECRKQREGNMCPSFRATRDEQHSTRGRANALRLALTGQLDLSGLTDPSLHEALDLCLECKACKSECPTNVDMARLKAEFLHQHGEKHGHSLRARTLGHIAPLARWGSRLAPISNWLTRGRLGRWLGERLLQIDRRRLPPAFAGRTLTTRLSQATPMGDSGRPAVFFLDTFANYFEPELGLAAIRLLARAGYRLQFLGPPEVLCCGRPFISQGLLGEAARCAEHNVARLYPLAAQGIPITACEPSCLLTIKDDYPALLRGDAQQKAREVAASCQTFEECLSAGTLRTGENGAGTTVRAPRILVQAHCHQRSLVGTQALLEILRHQGGSPVVELDTGCCGMAGSFGYEREHYEISRLVGEQGLFPAIRSAAPSDVIIAPGFSCRMQIEHFTGRKALHPASLLAMHLEPGCT